MQHYFHYFFEKFDLFVDHCF